MVFDRHREHVEKNSNHNSHVKLLVRDDVKERQRTSQLGLRDGFLWLFGAEFLHGVVILFLVFSHEELLRSRLWVGGWW